MEQELKQSFPHATISLIDGSGGVFDVHVDERLLFSKKQQKVKRFPEPGELTKILQAIQS